MDVALLVSILIGLALFLLAALGTVLFLYLKWTREVDETVSIIETYLNEVNERVRGVVLAIQEYTPIQRQPYIGTVQELMERMQKADLQRRDVENILNTLYDRLNTIPGTPFQQLLRAFPEAQENHVLAKQLRGAQNNLETSLKDCERLVDRLRRLPEQIHKRVFQAASKMDEFQSLLGKLKEAGVQGENVLRAEDALEQLLNLRQQLPAELLAPAPPEDRVEIREAVTMAYARLEHIEPVLDEWLPRVRAWWQDYQRALDAYENLRNRARHFRTVLETPPPSLIINEFIEVLDQVRQQAKDLNQRLSQPQVDDLSAIARDAEQLDQKIIQAAERYDRATRALTELDRVLLEIETLHQQAQELMEKSEQRKVYPIQWQASRPLWEKHSEQMETLGNRERRRTPDEIDQALVKGAKLREETARLLEGIQDSVSTHTELIKLLQHPHLAEGRTFLASVQPIIEAIRTFDPVNWRKEERFNELDGEYKEISRLQAQVVPADVSAPLPETILKTRLQEAQTLKSLHEKLRPRFQQAKARLDELREKQNSAQEDLNRALKTIDHLILLLNDQPFLRDLASSELKRLSTEIPLKQVELNQPSHGAVEKKVSQAQVLLDEFNRSLILWLEKLNQEVTTQAGRLEKMLAQLDEVAKIQDRAVQDARTLAGRLSAPPSFNPAGMGFSELAGELKRRSNEWQAVTASAQALENLSRDVLSSHQEVQQGLKAVQELLQQAGRRASGRRTWPPHRQSFADLVSQYHNLLNRHQALRERTCSPTEAVKLLGDITRELDRLEQQLEQALREADREEQEVIQREREVEDLTRRWEGLEARFGMGNSTSQDIQAMLRQAKNRVEFIRQQYQRGSLDYDTILRDLDTLIRELRSAVFTTEDGRQVTLEG
ncbi:MAG: hypothetical protein WHS45_05615 [Anaerolinea sp.]